jgi:hypothetical protein
MLLAQYKSMRPFLYETVEQPTVNSDDYGDIVPNAITTLHGEKIVVQFIDGDNLPAHVSALVHCNDKSRLPKKRPFLTQVKYAPCLCHFVELIVGDPILEGSRDKLKASQKSSRLGLRQIGNSHRD